VPLLFPTPYRISSVQRFSVTDDPPTQICRVQSMAIPAARPIANPAISLLRPKAVAAPVKVATGALLVALAGAVKFDDGLMALLASVVGTWGCPSPIWLTAAAVLVGAWTVI